MLDGWVSPSKFKISCSTSLAVGVVVISWKPWGHVTSYSSVRPSVPRASLTEEDSLSVSCLHSSIGILVLNIWEIVHDDLRSSQFPANIKQMAGKLIFSTRSEGISPTIHCLLLVAVVCKIRHACVNVNSLPTQCQSESL